tara:strand:+ start:116 stop:379 length:264 start_codon:yes stop_codon:yes gene_type:complete
MTADAAEWTTQAYLDARVLHSRPIESLGVISEVAEQCLHHTEENRGEAPISVKAISSKMFDAWKRLGYGLGLLLEDTSSNPLSELED